MDKNSQIKEYPVQFNCHGDTLTGIIHRPNDLKPGAMAVVIVVAGGPQYRVGAHRQFVQLARKLAEEGIVVLRFDLRGTGDSEGEHRGYEDSDPDIVAAIDSLLQHEQNISSIFLFGECESASGIIFYAYTDKRIKGLILVNPWVRTEEGQARTYIKHYYLNRLISSEFWHKVVSGKYNFVESIWSFLTNFSKSIRANIPSNENISIEISRDEFSSLPLPMRTVKGMQLFSGPALFLISGNDYIAKEFDEIVLISKDWKNIFQEDRILRSDIKDADHTFSKEEWKDEARTKIITWLNGLPT